MNVRLPDLEAGKPLASTDPLSTLVWISYVLGKVRDGWTVTLVRDGDTVMVTMEPGDGEG